MRLLGCFGLAISALMLPASSALASPSAKLTYARDQEAASCPDESGLRSAVAQRLGYDPFFPSAPKTVIVEVSRKGGTYRARVQIVGATGLAHGARELSTKGSDCSELLTAMALAISIALDDLDEPAPAKDDPLTPPAAAKGPEEPPPERQPPPRAEAPSPPLRAAPPPRFELAIGPLVSFGIAPAPNVGGVLTGRIRWEGASLALEAHGDLPLEASVTRGAVKAQWFGGAAVVCKHVGVFAACAAGEAGVLTARGSGLSAPTDASAAMFGIGARASASFPLGKRLIVSPNLDVFVNLRRHTLSVDGLPAFRQGLFLARAGLTLGVHFL